MFMWANNYVQNLEASLNTLKIEFSLKLKEEK